MGKKLPFVSFNSLSGSSYRVQNITTAHNTAITSRDTVHSYIQPFLADKVYDIYTKSEISLPGYKILRHGCYSATYTGGGMQPSVPMGTPQDNYQGRAQLQPPMVVLSKGLIGDGRAPRERLASDNNNYYYFPTWLLSSLTRIPGYGYLSTLTNGKNNYPNNLYASSKSLPNIQNIVFKSAAKHSTKLGSDDPATFYDVSVFSDEFLESLGDLSEYDDPYLSLSPIYGYQSTPYQPLFPYIHEERLKLEQQGKTPREIYEYFRDNDFTITPRVAQASITNYRFDISVLYWLIPETILEETYVITNTICDMSYLSGIYGNVVSSSNLYGPLPVNYSVRTQSTLVVN